MAGRPGRAAGEKPWWDRLAVGCLLWLVGIGLGGMVGGIIGAAISDPDEFLGELDIYAGIFIGAVVGGVLPLLVVLIRLAYGFVRTKRQDSI